MGAFPVLPTASEATLPELGKRITEAVTAAGGRAAVSRLSGVPYSSLDRYMAAKSEPPALTIANLAAACGVTIQWLLTGQTESGSVMLRPADVSNLEEFVSIPRLDIRASAGPGQAVVPAEGDRPSFIAFREQWLRSLGVNPRNAEFIESHGDSMEPTIQDGDLLLIDRGIDRVKSNGIYVLVAQGLVLVKRLQLLIGGSLLIISDNPKYEREVVKPDAVADLRVEGRVRWYGRAI